MKRAAIYARYSTDLQSKLSVRDQLDLCHDRCDSEGWSVVHAFSDKAMSGADSNRPGYQQLRAMIEERQIDIVVAESLSRLSRDEEQCYNLYKHCEFHGVLLYTLSEGEISPMLLSVVATMGAMQRRASAEQAWRGIRGKVINDGANVSRPPYGYRIPLNAHGKPIKGKLEVDPAQADIVQRILEDYAKGLSPKAIASALNKDGIPAPAGGTWKSNTINGNRKRGIGILNNELYIGKRVWNRQKFVRHPKTNNRIAQPNPTEDWLIYDAPELRIVPDGLWIQVKARQAELDKKRAAKDTGDHTHCSGAHVNRRPTYLLSGLIRCGCCGGPMNIGGGNPKRYYCANARERGDTVCTGIKGIKKDALESTVLSDIKEHLMQPEAVDQFLKAYAVEFNKLNAHKRQQKSALQTHLKGIERDIMGIMNAIKMGIFTSSTKDELERLESEKAEVEAKLATATDELPDIHPGIADLYRQKVENLIESLNAKETRTEAAEAVRKLLDKVIVNYDEDLKDHVIEIQGELAALLGLADNKNAASYEETASSLKLVAGAGFEPATFRL